MTDHVELEEPEESEKPKKPTTHDERGMADLERVTGYFEEKEVTVGLDAIKAFSSPSTASGVSDKAQKEKQLLKIKVKSEDINIVCQELEVTKLVAERRLKENQGDVYKTLLAFVK